MFGGGTCFPGEACKDTVNESDSETEFDWVALTVFCQVICPYPAGGGSTQGPPPFRMATVTGWVIPAPPP